MAKIVMLRNCVVEGEPRKIDDSVECGAAAAHYLVGRRLARYEEDLGEAKSEGLTTRNGPSGKKKKG